MPTFKLALTLTAAASLVVALAGCSGSTAADEDTESGSGAATAATGSRTSSARQACEGGKAACDYQCKDDTTCTDACTATNAACLVVVQHYHEASARCGGFASCNGDSVCSNTVTVCRLEGCANAVAQCEAELGPGRLCHDAAGWFC